MPGKQSMGLLMTAGLGVVGSLIGGAVGSAVSGRSLLEFNTAGIVGSVIGALILLAGMAFMQRRQLA